MNPDSLPATLQHQESWFADDYALARHNFLAACDTAGAQARSFVHPASATCSTELAVDVARFGDPDAGRLLVLLSGVHGPELMSGSGCQTGWIRCRRYAELPAGTGVLMIHAINPWGAANLRRNNEDNVDLNRNFLDFGRELPCNADYEQLHEALACPEYDGPLREQARTALLDFRRHKGDQVFMSALMSGQYRHAEGFGYGGASPVWSNRLLLKILREEARAARRICVVEYHSGLGPYGYGMIVSMASGEELARARQWFGAWLHAPRAERDEDQLHASAGHSYDGIVGALPGREVTPVVLEFGTYSAERNLRALLDDHWLAHHGDPRSELGRQIREENLRCHYPDDPEWRAALWCRSEQVIRQALRGMS